MAFDIVTAKRGYNHVTADQASDMQAGIFGKGRYALDTANGLACSMTDSNTLTVDTGSLIADGRHIVNDRAATFAIANGAQAAYRHDLAVLNVSIDSSTGVTTIEQDVLQGTPAASESAAEDPDYTAGNLLDGDLEATIPVARVSLAGLTPTCEPMLSSVSSLATLGDSVSRKVAFFSSQTESITVTAPFDCMIEVDLWMENQWPYGGGTVVFGVTSDGLTSDYEVIGKLSYGNTIGRTAHAKRVVSGAKAGTSYTFRLTVAEGSFGGTQASTMMEAKCWPV